MDTIIIIIIVLIAILFLFYFYKLYSLFNRPGKLINAPRHHDHLKRCHDTQLSALNEISRMRYKNIEGSERMNAYFSESRQCWLVGKSSLKR